MPRTEEETQERLKRGKKLLKAQTRKKDRKENKYNNLQKQEAHERVMRALELIRGGMSYRAIVEANIGYSSPGAVHTAVQRYRRKEIRTVAADVIALDLERLDEYQQRATYALRQNGDLSQIDRLLRIMHERYGLLAMTQEDIKQVRDAGGLATTVTNNNNTVMVVTQRETSEVDFVKTMMQAVNVDPESPEAQQYLVARTVKEIEAKKTSKKGRKVIVKKSKKSAPAHIAKSYGELAEEEIVDAEIVP